MNGIDDRWIYYDPVVAASIVFSGDPIPVHNTDYSYYMDALGRSYDSKKSFKELVEKEHLYCVHEIQHYLRKKYGSDNLRINENRIEQWLPLFIPFILQAIAFEAYTISFMAYILEIQWFKKIKVQSLRLVLKRWP